MDADRGFSPFGTIYVVDDDTTVLSALELLLPQIGAPAVRTFTSGDAFIRELPDLAGGCVLLDLNMPGGSGLDVLRASANHLHDFAFVILSGEGLIASAVEALKLGAVDYLEKPHQPDRLREVIERAFAHIEQRSGGNREREEARASLARLSAREHEVLLGLIEGKPHKVIAHDLHLSFRTIEIYRHKLMKKLGVRSLSDALGIAFRAGLKGDAGSDGVSAAH